jgi:hypothetical protein
VGYHLYYELWLSQNPNVPNANEAVDFIFYRSCTKSSLYLSQLINGSQGSIQHFVSNKFIAISQGSRNKERKQRHNLKKNEFLHLQRLH